jgi:hypothetical protein
MVGATGFTHLKIGITNRQLGIKRHLPFPRVNLAHGKKRSAENSVGRQLTTKKGSTQRSRMK